MEIIEIQQSLDYLYSQGESEKAYSLLLEQLNEAMKNQRDDIVLFLLSELIGYYRVTAQFELGNQIAMQAIKILMSHQLENSIPAATTYLNIATLYRAQGQYQNSLKMYQQCEQIYQEQLNEKDERYASFYNNVSLLYQEMGDFHKALDYELKALSIIERLKNCEIEEAITYANLSQMYFSTHENQKAIDCINKSIALFELYGPNDPHFYAALSSKAQYHFLNKEYNQAIKLYDQVLEGLEKAYGKNKDYYTVMNNREKVIKEMNDQHIKGIKLCHQYYLTYGKEMLERDFKEYLPYMAIGLFGNGSDCLGYDDEISIDHDFGPGFCILLPSDIYEKIGGTLQDAYHQLPEEFMDVHRITSRQGQGRVGVFPLHQFFGQFIKHLPATLEDWLYCDENGLLACTNGMIFEDHYGEVTHIRNILKYYPEDVRIKKIVRAIAKMAQSGQYNYARCMQRKDEVAASLALNEFIDQTLSCIYLLNKKYKPYYKWSFKGLDDCFKLKEVKPMIEDLVLLDSQKQAWEQHTMGLNMNDKKVVLIEKICQKIITELKNQGLTNSDDDFLENHTLMVMSHIKDQTIRNKHIMEG